MDQRIQIQLHHFLAGILCIVLLLTVGCSSVKPAQKRTTPHDQPKKETDAPRVYNPSTGKYEPVEDPKKMVDTIEFREDKKTIPIGSSDERKTGKKALYEVAFLIPFDADDNPSYTGSMDPKVRRFLHYYGGVKMALQDLADRGLRISASVYDTQDSPEQAKRLIQSLDHVDAVVGPYEMESLRDAALFSTRKKVPVFSPWTPSIPLDSDNPWFIQLNPGLEAHAVAIVDYLDTHMGDAKVYMVARNDVREKNRLNLFRDAHAKNTALPSYEELIIDDASANLNKTLLNKLIAHKGSTVFIMPYYSRNDEDFVSAFLRKLHAEKGTGTVFVFGMPQWLTFNKLNSDYLESANVHVSTAHFMDPSDPDVRAFHTRFLEEYGTLPEPAAHQAFEFMLFLGEALNNYGTGFLDFVSDRLHASTGDVFDLVPVYRNPIPEKQNVPNYLENHAIHILHFKDQAFRRVE